MKYFKTLISLNSKIILYLLIKKKMVINDNKYKLAK